MPNDEDRPHPKEGPTEDAEDREEQPTAEQTEALRDISVDELVAILADHKKWLETNGEEGKQADLERANLQKIVLPRVNLERAILCSANLQEADLHHANFLEADLRQADLRNANLRGTVFEAADLRYANLRNANLRDAHLRRVNLSSADLQEASLPKALLQGADLSEAKLQKTKFRNADLEDANLQAANLQEADLQGANLLRANLITANLQNARLRDTCLQEGNLFEANLQSTYLRNANLQGANLEDAKLEGANLREANLQTAYLIGANLQRARLSNANLQNANLFGANLQRADLSGANLQGAVLHGANLRGANLRNAYLEALKQNKDQPDNDEEAGSEQTGDADVQPTDLRLADLRDADLSDAKLSTVTGLQSGQLGGADLSNAKLPDDIAKFEGLAHVTEISKHARNIFLAVVGGCVFSWLTIATTTDVALLTNSVLLGRAGDPAGAVCIPSHVLTAALERLGQPSGDFPGRPQARRAGLPVAVDESRRRECAEPNRQAAAVLAPSGSILDPLRMDSGSGDDRFVLAALPANPRLDRHGRSRRLADARGHRRCLLLLAGTRDFARSRTPEIPLENSMETRLRLCAFGACFVRRGGRHRRNRRRDKQRLSVA